MRTGEWAMLAVALFLVIGSAFLLALDAWRISCRSRHMTAEAENYLHQEQEK